MQEEKKNLMKEVKKMLNAKLERHLARPHTLMYEVSAFIYILIRVHLLFTCLSHLMFGTVD